MPDITIVKQRYGHKISDDTLCVFHFETDSDMILIEGEDGVTLTNKLKTLTQSRTISLSGDVSGSATYNGVDNIDIEVSVGDDSHNHTGATIMAGAPNSVVVTGANGAITVSSVTDTELSFLSGVTSAIQAQLDEKAPGDHNHDNVYLKQLLLGSINGVAPLSADGKIPAQYLPSFVDDVIEGTFNEDYTEFTPSGASEPITPESGKIYSDVDNNRTYRWGGTYYVFMGEGVGLGETWDTAYRGDRGKIAYEHSQENHAPANATVVKASSTNGNVLINDVETKVYTHPSHTAVASGLYKVTVDALGHITAVSAVTKEDITNLGIPGTDNNTTNTAGSTNTSSKIFLIGATSQAENPQTFSHDTAYVGTDGCLYSNGKRVVNVAVSATQPTDQVAGDYWCETLS